MLSTSRETEWGGGPIAVHGLWWPTVVCALQIRSTSSIVQWTGEDATEGTTLCAIGCKVADICGCVEHRCRASDCSHKWCCADTTDGVSQCTRMQCHACSRAMNSLCKVLCHPDLVLSLHDPFACCSLESDCVGHGCVRFAFVFAVPHNHPSLRSAAQISC
jgi:hypothetical protein